MQLLAKINEDGTDLSLETWLDSAFILPFKVVQYCNIYVINVYLKNRCYILFLFFLRAPNFPPINRISVKDCFRSPLSTTEGILINIKYYKILNILFLRKITNILILSGILCFYNLRMLWKACSGTYMCICSFNT